MRGSRSTGQLHPGPEQESLSASLCRSSVLGEMLPAALSGSSAPGLFWKAEPWLRQPRAAALSSAWQPEAARGGERGLSSFHSSNRKTRDCSTWKNSTHTCAHAPRHTPHTPGTKASMFRPSAGRDARQRRAVQISRGSLVLVDSPRKNNLQRWLQHSCVRSVGYLVFGNCKRGKQGCVLQEGEGMEVQCCVSRCAPGSAASQGVGSGERKEGS